MKKLFPIFSTLLLTLGLSQSALAQWAPAFKSDLIKINANEQFGSNPHSGHIVFDSTNNTLNLTILFAGHRCPPGSFCPAYLPAPLFVNLPIVKVKTNTCGAKVLVAEEDKLPVDGAYKKLTITDNSTNHCNYVLPIPAVAGEYTESYMDRRNGVITLKATFEGTSFKEIPSIEN